MPATHLSACSQTGFYPLALVAMSSPLFCVLSPSPVGRLPQGSGSVSALGPEEGWEASKCPCSGGARG